MAISIEELLADYSNKRGETKRVNTELFNSVNRRKLQFDDFNSSIDDLIATTTTHDGIRKTKDIAEKQFRYAGRNNLQATSQVIKNKMEMLDDRAELISLFDTTYESFNSRVHNLELDNFIDSSDEWSEFDDMWKNKTKGMTNEYSSPAEFLQSELKNTDLVVATLSQGIKGGLSKNGIKQDQLLLQKAMTYQDQLNMALRLGLDGSIDKQDVEMIMRGDVQGLQDHMTKMQTFWPQAWNSSLTRENSMKGQLRTFESSLSDQDGITAELLLSYINAAGEEGMTEKYSEELQRLQGSTISPNSKMIQDIREDFAISIGDEEGRRNDIESKYLGLFGYPMFDRGTSSTFGDYSDDNGDRDYSTGYSFGGFMQQREEDIFNHYVNNFDKYSPQSLKSFFGTDDIKSIKNIVAGQMVDKYPNKYMLNKDGLLVDKAAAKNITPESVIDKSQQEIAEIVLNELEAHDGDPSQSVLVNGMPDPDAIIDAYQWLEKNNMEKQQATSQFINLNPQSKEDKYVSSSKKDELIARGTYSEDDFVNMADFIKKQATDGAQNFENSGNLADLFLTDDKYIISNEEYLPIILDASEDWFGNVRTAETKNRFTFSLGYPGETKPYPEPKVTRDGTEYTEREKPHQIKEGNVDALMTINEFLFDNVLKSPTDFYRNNEKYVSPYSINNYVGNNWFSPSGDEFIELDDGRKVSQYLFHDEFYPGRENTKAGSDNLLGYTMAGNYLNPVVQFDDMARTLIGAKVLAEEKGIDGFKQQHPELYEKVKNIMNWYSKYDPFKFSTEYGHQAPIGGFYGSNYHSFVLDPPYQAGSGGIPLEDYMKDRIRENTKELDTEPSTTVAKPNVQGFRHEDETVKVKLDASPTSSQQNKALYDIYNKKYGAVFPYYDYDGIPSDAGAMQEGGMYGGDALTALGTIVDRGFEYEKDYTIDSYIKGKGKHGNATKESLNSLIHDSADPKIIDIVNLFMEWHNAGYGKQEIARTIRNGYPLSHLRDETRKQHSVDKDILALNKKLFGDVDIGRKHTNTIMALYFMWGKELGILNEIISPKVFGKPWMGKLSKTGV